MTNTHTALDQAAALKMQYELYDVALIDNRCLPVEQGLVVPVPGFAEVKADKLFSQASAFIADNPADGYTVGEFDGKLGIQTVHLPQDEGEALRLAEELGAEIWDITRGIVDRQFVK